VKKGEIVPTDFSELSSKRRKHLKKNSCSQEAQGGHTEFLHSFMTDPGKKTGCVAVKNGLAWGKKGIEKRSGWSETVSASG